MLGWIILGVIVVMLILAVVWPKGGGERTISSDELNRSYRGRRRT